jgi:hypothetical protein
MYIEYHIRASIEKLKVEVELISFLYTQVSSMHSFSIQFFKNSSGKSSSNNVKSAELLTDTQHPSSYSSLTLIVIYLKIIHQISSSGDALLSIQYRISRELRFFMNFKTCELILEKIPTCG